MTHFLYLIAFSILVGSAFGLLAEGESKDRVRRGVKSALQFFVVALAVAWLFYFIPW
jgi:NhaP-type Na+/H+ or K+/H+ antiporter